MLSFLFRFFLTASFLVLSHLLMNTGLLLSDLNYLVVFHFVERHTMTCDLPLPGFQPMLWFVRHNLFELRNISDNCLLVAFCCCHCLLFRCYCQRFGIEEWLCSGLPMLDQNFISWLDMLGLSIFPGIIIMFQSQFVLLVTGLQFSGEI